jgi:hypothetical protein
MDKAVALAMSALADPTIPLRRNLLPSEDKISEMFWVWTDWMYRFKNGAFDTIFESEYKDNQCALGQGERKKADLFSKSAFLYTVGIFLSEQLIHYLSHAGLMHFAGTSSW